MNLTNLLPLTLVATLFSVQAIAQDTLSSVLDRLRVKETRHFSYQETRHLQLLAEPWQATGNMYTSPQQMVIAQQSPSAVLTVISTGRILHNDVEQDIHISLKLEQPFAVPGMEPFMQLLYGTAEHTKLDQNYVIKLNTTGHRWSLQLAPHQHTRHEIIRMQISGETGHGADYLVLETANGDHTEWRLSLLSQGVTADQEMQLTLDQLTNH